MYLSIFLSIYLCIYLSIHLSVCLSIYLSTYLSLYLSICLSIYLSICLSVCLSICLSVYLSICLSVYLSICLSVYLSLSLSIYLSIYLSVYLSIYLSLSIYLPIYLSFFYVSIFIYICVYIYRYILGATRKYSFINIYIYTSLCLEPAHQDLRGVGPHPFSAFARILVHVWIGVWNEDRAHQHYHHYPFVLAILDRSPKQIAMNVFVVARIHCPIEFILKLTLVAVCPYNVMDVVGFPRVLLQNIGPVIERRHAMLILFLKVSRHHSSAIDRLIDRQSLFSLLEGFIACSHTRSTCSETESSDRIARIIACVSVEINRMILVVSVHIRQTMKCYILRVPGLATSFTKPLPTQWEGEKNK